MNRIKEFLKELSELTKKYELEIGGCGCCGSPWITDLKQGYIGEDGLYYDHKEQKYKVDSMGDEEDDDE